MTADILEGRVAILVDKSPFAVLVPITVNELYQSAEDFYFNFWLASFTQIIRFTGNVLAIGLPGLYVSFGAVNPDLLPTQYALILASARAHAPIPLAAEVLILEVAVGIFYEAGLRLLGSLSQTIGIVAGITLGLVGIFSGIVSPATMIVVAFTAIASYTGPNLAPWAPLQWPELTNGVVMAPLWSRWTRPKTYRSQDHLRSGGTKREDDEND